VDSPRAIWNGPEGAGLLPSDRGCADNGASPPIRCWPSVTSATP